MRVERDVVGLGGLAVGARAHRLGSLFAAHATLQLAHRLYNQRELGTPWETTNVNGGAVPLGHPYGMSGVRYIGSALLELGRRNKKRAIIGVCTAGGMGTAALLERA